MRAVRALLQREDELSRAKELLARARAGEGTVLVVEGAAGAGKTRLLREISGRARDDGFAVLAARGAELERGFAFGLLRQVLEPALVLLEERDQDRLLSGASAPARAVLAAEPVGEGDRRSDPFAALNGLFWLLAGLADRHPLLLALDDVHWADEPSLRFLAFALGRVESVPVLILATRRPAAGEPGDALVAAIAAGATTLRLPALGSDSVRTLVAEHLGQDPSERFSEACRATSGGNPFLLVELLRALSREGVSPTEDNVGRVAAVSPENVARSVAARLERIGEVGARFARALAAVGDDAPLGLVAQAGGLAVDDASLAADALAAAGLIARHRPLRFEHPLLRTAVEATFTPGERLRVHGRAAALLQTAGAPAERIALHLLETEPAGDEARAQILADAGRAALARGAPETAARLLARALDEPPPAAHRSEVLLGLGIAEREQGIASAVDRLREAAQVAEDPRLAARAARELGWAAGPRPDAQRDLIPLYERAAEAVRALDGQLALALEARRLAALLLNPGGSPVKSQDVV